MATAKTGCICDLNVRRLLGEALGNPGCETADEWDDLQGYGMDSLNCVCLALALEEAFGFEIPESMLGLKHMRTIHDILALASLLAAGASEPAEPPPAGDHGRKLPGKGHNNSQAAEV